MSAVYLPGEGVLVTIIGKDEGLSVLIHPAMTVAAMESHLADLVEWLA